jgi:hypothetical protein
VIFVEGKDFLIISKFARLLGFHQVANRSDFAVVPVEGFNPDRIRSLKAGMEATLGRSIAAAALLDKDYRSDAERAAILRDCEDICDFITIHRRKEIENFLLVASALDRACERKVVDRAKRGGERAAYVPTMGDLLEQFCASKRTYVLAHYLENGRRFARANSPSLSDATVSERVLTEFDPAWCDSRLELVPGKEALSFINQHVQAEYGVALTATAVLDTMRRDEVPEEMSELIGELAKFAASKPRSREALAA